jgi:hypothetical protein
VRPEEKGEARYASSDCASHDGRIGSTAHRRRTSTACSCNACSRGTDAAGGREGSFQAGIDAAELIAEFDRALADAVISRGEPRRPTAHDKAAQRKRSLAECFRIFLRLF